MKQLVSLMAVVLTVALATQVSAVDVVRDNFNSDEGSDGNLLGDTTDTGQTWATGLITGTGMNVGPQFGQDGNGAGSASGSTSQLVVFDAPLTSGTWYMSYDIHIGGHSGGDMQNILRGGGTGNSSFVIGQGSGGSTGIYQEGLGGGAQGTVAGLFTNPPTNVFIQGAYDLDNNTLTVTYEDIDNPGNGSGSYVLNISAGYQPESFEMFRNAGPAGNDVGIDNLWIADRPIPEPASLALLGLGGLAMLRRKRA